MAHRFTKEEQSRGGSAGTHFQDEARRLNLIEARKKQAFKDDAVWKGALSWSTRFRGR